MFEPIDGPTILKNANFVELLMSMVVEQFWIVIDLENDRFWKPAFNVPHKHDEFWWDIAPVTLQALDQQGMSV